MKPQDNSNIGDTWENELRLYAPLTIENAPEGFVERVMARIGEVDNFSVVTQADTPAPRRTDARIRRMLPIAATAAAVMLLFVMPALQRGSLMDPSLPESSTLSALESAPAPKVAMRQSGASATEGDAAEGEEVKGQEVWGEEPQGEAVDGGASDTVTPFMAPSNDGAAPEGGAPTEKIRSESGEAALDNGLPTPFQSALSRGCGGTVGEGNGGDYCLLYGGATGRPAGIAFCVILEGGTPPEDVLPAVPGQYLITSEQLEALLEAQPEGVVPVYVEEGLTPTAAVGLVIIREPPADN
ncbi:MAG TPA: hypothetical protein VN446_02170 [Candidatus Acidoferrum sp.]|nr:hypothetical protein [Candidatus Acidoferrum sp.]